MKFLIFLPLSKLLFYIMKRAADHCHYIYNNTYILKNINYIEVFFRHLSSFVNIKIANSSTYIFLKTFFSLINSFYIPSLWNVIYKKSLSLYLSSLTFFPIILPRHSLRYPSRISLTHSYSHTYTHPSTYHTPTLLFRLS